MLEMVWAGGRFWRGIWVGWRSVGVGIYGILGLTVSRIVKECLKQRWLLKWRKYQLLIFFQVICSTICDSKTLAPRATYNLSIQQFQYPLHTYTQPTMSQPSSSTAKKRKTAETVDVPPNSIASYFKVLEHPINTFTTTTTPKLEASTEDSPSDDIESSDSEDKADDKDSPLVPLHRPCSSIALTLLSSRVRTRSPYTIPPSVEVASLKRFKSRTRLIPPPNNVYSNR